MESFGSFNNGCNTFKALLLFHIFGTLPKRLVTLETCYQSDEETCPDKPKDKDKDKDTNKITMTKTNTMKNTKTKTFREHPQRAAQETCDLRLDT